MLAIHHPQFEKHKSRWLGGAGHKFCLFPLSLSFLICEVVIGGCCRVFMRIRKAVLGSAHTMSGTQKVAGSGNLCSEGRDGRRQQAVWVEGEGLGALPTVASPALTWSCRNTWLGWV